MKFIAKHILAGDERVIYATRLHWIYLVIGLLWAAVFISIGLLLAYYMLMHASDAGAAQRFMLLGYDLGFTFLWILGAFVGTGVGLFLMHLFKVVSTEVALTTDRIIHKTGLVFVEVEEIDMDEIEAVRVRHGMFGALLGYGTLLLDCRFVGDIRLPAIRNPHKFLRTLHKVRTQAGHKPVVA